MAASAAVLVGPPINAAEDRGGHGVAADCGEPWKNEARKMAENLADPFLHATELQQELSRKKADMQRAVAELIAAADAVIEARGQTARAKSVGERLHTAAVQALQEKEERKAELKRRRGAFRDLLERTK